MVRALVIFTTGVEEMELVTIVDMLRRADIEVTMANLEPSDDGQPIECSRKCRIMADCSFAEAMASAPYDAIILPGGMPCAKALAASPNVGEALRVHELIPTCVIAAICASTIALTDHRICHEKTVTSHPSVEEHINRRGVHEYVGHSRVHVDGRLVTSQGPGTAIEFAVKLIDMLMGRAKRDQVAAPMILHLPNEAK